MTTPNWTLEKVLGYSVGVAMIGKTKSGERCASVDAFIRRFGRRFGITMSTGAALLCCRIATAQPIADVVDNDTITNRPLVLITALAGLAMVPFLLIMVTSFVKIAVVLSIVRQAIGTQQIPPTQVITGMAIVLTVYIMMPVGLEIYHDIQQNVLDKKVLEKTDATTKPKKPTKKSKRRGSTAKAIAKATGTTGKTLIGDVTVEEAIEIGERAQVPMRGFLIKHAHLKDRDMFYKLAWRMRNPRDRAELSDEDWTIIIPAFVISELKEAFQIGFILFVPFLVVDMVVANILMALGMQMLSPTTISLPFKILLFVLVDGWYLITKGLVIGYQ